jgi:hypothetical protein
MTFWALVDSKGNFYHLKKGTSKKQAEKLAREYHAERIVKVNQAG